MKALRNILPSIISVILVQALLISPLSQFRYVHEQSSALAPELFISSHLVQQHIIALSVPQNALGEIIPAQEEQGIRVLSGKSPSELEELLLKIGLNISRVGCDFDETAVEQKAHKMLAKISIRRARERYGKWSLGIPALCIKALSVLYNYHSYKKTASTEKLFKMFAGITQEDITRLAEQLTLNPAMVNIIREIKQARGLDTIDVVIISRGMSELIEGFFAREDIKNTLKKEGIQVRVIAANAAKFEDGVLKGVKPSEYYITPNNKPDYISKEHAYITDAEEAKRGIGNTHKAFFVTDAEKSKLIRERIERYLEPELTFEGTSGIRGRAEELARAARYLAVAFAQTNKAHEAEVIYVGYDTRLSSKSIAKEVALVLVNTFKQMSTVERGSLPEVRLSEFPISSPGLCRFIAKCTAEKKRNALGIMITGSHNPSGDNGFCPRGENGAVMIEGMSNIYERYRQLRKAYIPPTGLKDLVSALKNRHITIIRQDEQIDLYTQDVINKPIIQHIINSIKQRRNAENMGEVSLLYDAMKGAGAYIVPHLLADVLGVDVKGVDEEGAIVDFRSYTPSLQRTDRKPYPNRKMIRGWQRAMEMTGVQFLLSNDGDADRFGVVENGEFIDWNELFVLLIDYLGQLGIIQEEEFTHIVATHTTTAALEKIGQKYDLTVETVPVGFKYISKKIEELEKGGKKVLGGFEGNGGMVLRIDKFAVDKDGVMANILFALIKADCQMQGITLKERIIKAQQDAELDANFGYMKEVDVLFDEAGQKYLEYLRGVESGFLVREIDDERSVIINPDKSAEKHQRKIVFTDGSWVLFRPSGTEKGKARIYVEAGGIMARNRLLIDFLTDMGENTTEDMGTERFTEITAEAITAEISDYLATVNDEQSFQNIANQLIVLRNNSGKMYDRIVDNVRQQAKNVRAKHGLSEIISVIELAGLYDIPLQEKTYELLAAAVAKQIFNDVVLPKDEIRGKTRLLLTSDESTRKKTKSLLYRLLSSPDYLVFSDPHATYRSVAKLLASYPTARPVVIGDVTYRGKHLFELMELLQKAGTAFLYGEKELWYVGACLGNSFLTALSVGSELRYGNERILEKLGIELDKLRRFAGEFYDENKRAELKKRLPGSVNSITEQAMFNIRLKLNPLLSPLEKAFMLVRIPDENIVRSSDEKRTREEQALVEKLRGNSQIGLSALTHREKESLKEMLDKYYLLTKEEEDLLHNVQKQFVSSAQARGLLRDIVGKFKLFEIIRPSPLVESIDERFGNIAELHWQKNPTAILLHGNVITDENGQFLDIDGKVLDRSVLSYYLDINKQLNEYTVYIERRLDCLENGEINTDEFIQQVNSHAGARLLEKLALSPYSPLFARQEMGAEYCYVQSVREPDNPSYHFQLRNESGNFMSTVFQQFNVDNKKSLLVLGHRSNPEGKVRITAQGQVLLVDAHFVEKYGKVDKADTDKGAGLIIGGSGVRSVFLEPGKAELLAPAVDDTILMERGEMFSNNFSGVSMEDTDYQDWLQRVLNERSGIMREKSLVLEKLEQLWMTHNLELICAEQELITTPAVVEQAI